MNSNQNSHKYARNLSEGDIFFGAGEWLMADSVTIVPGLRTQIVQIHTAIGIVPVPFHHLVKVV